MSCLSFNLHLRSKCPRVLHIWHLFHVFLTLHSQIIYNLLRCICYIRCEFYRQTYPAVDIILLQWSFTCVWSRALLTYALSVWSRVVNCLVSLWMVSPEVDFCFMDWAILTSSPRARSTLIRSLSWARWSVFYNYFVLIFSSVVSPYSQGRIMFSFFFLCFSHQYFV